MRCVAWELDTWAPVFTDTIPSGPQFPLLLLIPLWLSCFVANKIKARSRKENTSALCSSEPGRGLCILPPSPQFLHREPRSQKQRFCWLGLATCSGLEERQCCCNNGWKEPVWHHLSQELQSELLWFTYSLELEDGVDRRDPGLVSWGAGMATQRSLQTSLAELQCRHQADPRGET